MGLGPVFFKGADTGEVDGGARSHPLSVLTFQEELATRPGTKG
uniref:Uncharacterized protein n=1 Tax=Rhizophora mucronata TaxID=61149 RepID=A0A2P2QN52_RHIMU